MRIRLHEGKGAVVQIIHAKFVVSSVMILSEIPKKYVHHRRKVDTVGEGVDVLTL